MNTTTTRPRIDYGQLAAQLNYAALDQKLEQLREQTPPKKRKSIGNVLAPVDSRLRELRAKGWTYEQLAKELNDFGLPMKPSALRDYLTTKEAKPSRRRQHKSVSPLSGKSSEPIISIIG